MPPKHLNSPSHHTLGFQQIRHKVAVMVSGYPWSPPLAQAAEETLAYTWAIDRLFFQKYYSLNRLFLFLDGLFLTYPQLASQIYHIPTKLIAPRQVKF